jgi:hypothetical protein
MDTFCQDPQCWVPPNLGDLVRAIRRTSLVRFFPFTAHACFCLSLRIDQWRPGIGDGRIAPAFISRTRDIGYYVWSGNPYRSDDATVVLTTDNPEDASAELERLLIEWPPL